MSDVDISRDRIEKLHSIGVLDYIHLAMLNRIEALNAQIERMWDALEYVDAHIDLEEEISEEFAETVRILLWENDE